MDTMIGFAVLVMATLVSLFTALALQGLLMKLAFHLMQSVTPIERGTRMVARVYARAAR